MTGASFLQMEFRNTASSGEKYIVEVGDGIPFDTEIIASEDVIGSKHILCDALGEITFTQKGVFFVSWFVAQQTGLAADGANFALEMTVDGERLAVIGSGHTKFSALSGFGVVNVPKAGTTLVLKNTAGARATLSKHTQVKAGLALFSLTPEQQEKKLGYMHRQTLVAVEYPTDSRLLFPTLIKNDPEGIVTYDDGVFTLGRKGTYLITWELPIEATDEFDEVYVALKYNGVVQSVSYAPLPIGVVTGSAVIINEAIDGEVELAVILEQASVGEPPADIVRVAGRANVVVTQIEDVVV